MAKKVQTRRHNFGAVIERDTYREAIQKLTEDPIIIEMASEFHDAFHKKPDDFVHADGSTPRWNFIVLADLEYRKRGGTTETFVAGPARAVLTVVKGAQA